MTEAAWLGCDDVVKVLEALRSRATGRKLRLFACAMGRTTWELLDDHGSRLAIEMSEQEADEKLAPGACAHALYRARGAVHELSIRLLSGRTPSEAMTDPNFRAAWYAAFALGGQVHDIDQHVGVADLGWFDPVAATALLRDIFGNPFAPVTFRPAWRTDTAVALAAGMYESRDFSAMAILADALQDAGCDNDTILNHCRGPGPHARGCHVLDLILGKS